MVTPDNVEELAQDNQNFKLHVAPDEDWLEYSPELINDDESCSTRL